ncbi:MAG: ATP-binding protein [Candidatus Nanoarchaeia archaeon]|nr:ATP-binding protein [Candidatus Nanoarchaeia archaeon]
MILGLTSVSRSYDGLLVPIAKYTLTRTLKEQAPKIATSLDFGSKPDIEDLQVDVYSTMPAINNITSIYDNKIITAHVKYGSFYVNCYAQTREESKAWIDNFENDMVKRNQYRGKCLYAEKESMFFRDVPRVSWDDVILTEKAKKDIRLNSIEFLSNEKFSSSGILKRGILMYGPPGTGKTSVVKAIFNELNNKKVSRLYVTAESFRYMPISKLFEFMAYLGPTVLAFEDIDMVSGNREANTASNLLGDLLTNLDGMRKFHEPIVVIASTNKIDLMDAALTNRPQRFDRRIEIGLPNNANLKTMYFKHLGSNVNEDIITLSKDFTGSHVVETVNTAKILATTSNKETIDCLNEACNIIRENFFPGQTTIEIKSSIQKYFSKKGYIKTSSILENNIEKIVDSFIPVNTTVNNIIDTYIKHK